LQRWFNPCKLIKIIYHINRLKEKCHLIICRDTEKAFDQIQHPFMIKDLKNLGLEGTHLNTMEATHDKCVFNILLSSKPFPLVRNKTKVNAVFALNQYNVRILGQNNKARERNKREKIGKKSNYPYLQMLGSYTRKTLKNLLKKY
jgi:hypothetical protein